MSTPTPPTDGMHQVQTTVNGCSSVEMMQTITSLELAEMANKTHKNLLRDIRKMEFAWEKVGRLKFEPTSYLDQWNREQKMYKLTKTESLYIATKFHDEARARLVLRWEELEKKSQKLPLEVLAAKLTNEIDQVRHEQYQLGAQLTNNRQRLKHLKMVLKETERQLVGQLSLTKNQGYERSVK